MNHNEAPKPNLNFSNPELKNVLDMLKKDIFQTLNCHALGTIVSFNPTKQTVRVKINYKKTFYEPVGNGSLRYAAKNIDYPILADVPIIVISGGSANLTMPIKPGDSCLILFSDRDIDNWHTTGDIVPLGSARMHSISDGIALVGLNSIVDSIESYDTDRAVLRNGTAMVGVGESLIKISNDVTTLKSVINNLIDIIITLTTAMSAATPGSVVATIAVPSGAATTSLTAHKTVVGTLLE